MNYGKINGVCNEIEPFTNKYACAVARKLNIKDYRITIYADPVGNTIYFELGFDDSHDYDTSMYIDPTVAGEIASKLDEIAKSCIDEHNKVAIAEDSLDIMIDRLKDGSVTKCEITVLDGYHETVFNTMFGKLVIKMVFYFDMPVDIKSEIHNNECEICMISTKRYHKKSKTYFKSLIEERINTLKKDYEDLDTEFVIDLDKYDDIYNAMQNIMVKDGLIEVPDND
jgi:hypothetical protein